mmetsp:Transcript_10473/g.14797  ORF Transcript_10473/g.14797 Transcript_10473/m.14797 type:complete len:402 (+) Transcript_10473:172-1377(+)|eukprot:CAMPEP_0184866562 /NCGR_PEP_ID=MMETSP0580-20130426/22792_1 /TAXON_ID=1118495 /ORGANISM="Dactyliosolen fragilissimus" /LENGTH=401 /DNA_ID=CAMNT_0027366301 /DNA_START=99 /DNA_END=1304 /DNA_ORIENTATION=+
MTSEHDREQNHALSNDDYLPPTLKASCIMTYRSVGLGLYGAAIRFLGMPLEKIALYMNSTQVSGSNQLRQAVVLTFTETVSNSEGFGVEKIRQTSLLAPFRVVGPASIVAWFLQYSVMGMVFQICDSALSNALGVPRIPYGSALMEDASKDPPQASDFSTSLKTSAKIVLAPVTAGIIESVVANRAEVQRYFGISKFSNVESAIRPSFLYKISGPAFIANSSRNIIMSSTSFVITPVLYRQFYPQDQKNKSSMFWFGLGVNIFIGNPIAITQQALWGRALDYMVANQSQPGEGIRRVNYNSVIREGLSREGMAAFFTLPKWGSRVLMNAPVQGTLPWFYNEILPQAENRVLNSFNTMYQSLVKKDRTKRIMEERRDVIYYSSTNDSQNTTAATSPVSSSNR